MMDGQKVVKVFCHEEKSIEEFQKLNEELRKSADNANTFANIMMPININLGLMFIGSGLGYSLAGLDIFASSFIFPKSHNESFTSYEFDKTNITFSSILN